MRMGRRDHINLFRHGFWVCSLLWMSARMICPKKEENQPDLHCASFLSRLFISWALSCFCVCAELKKSIGQYWSWSSYYNSMSESEKWMSCKPRKVVGRVGIILDIRTRANGLRNSCFNYYTTQMIVNRNKKLMELTEGFRSLRKNKEDDEMKQS